MYPKVFFWHVKTLSLYHFSSLFSCKVPLTMSNALSYHSQPNAIRLLKHSVSNLSWSFTVHCQRDYTSINMYKKMKCKWNCEYSNLAQLVHVMAVGMVLKTCLTLLCQSYIHSVPWKRPGFKWPVHYLSCYWLITIVVAGFLGITMPQQLQPSFGAKGLIPCFFAEQTGHMRQTISSNEDCCPGFLLPYLILPLSQYVST